MLRVVTLGSLRAFTRQGLPRRSFFVTQPLLSCPASAPVTERSGYQRRNIAKMALASPVPPTELGAPDNYLMDPSQYAERLGTTLVIGARRRLGLQMCKVLKEQNVRLLATCMTDKPSDELGDLNLEQVIRGIDLLDPMTPTKLVQSLQAHEVKRIDTLMIISGYFATEGPLEPDREQEKKMFEICSIGPTEIVSALAKAKLLGEGSRVGYITSESGIISLRTEKEGGANYGHHMSKAAANMAGKLLAWDLKPKGVSVVMLHPGFMRTDMTSDKFAHLYDELGAVYPEQAVPYILQAVVNTSVDNTGRLVAAMGAKSLGPSVWGLDHPENVKPGCELPF